LAHGCVPLTALVQTQDLNADVPPACFNVDGV